MDRCEALPSRPSPVPTGKSAAVIYHYSDYQSWKDLQREREPTDADKSEVTVEQIDKLEAAPRHLGKWKS